MCQNLLFGSSLRASQPFMDFLSGHRSGYDPPASDYYSTPSLTLLCFLSLLFLLIGPYALRSPEWMQQQHRTHLLDEKIARLEAALFT